MIPQFDTTYYIEVFHKVYSTKLSSQAFSVRSVERLQFLSDLALGLKPYFSGVTNTIGYTEIEYATNTPRTYNIVGR